MAPRVRPRTPLEDRVDLEVHPPIGRIGTEDEPEQVDGPQDWLDAWRMLHWLRRTALALLGVFLVAGTLGLLLAPFLGPWVAAAGLFCSGAALTVAILLGSE